MNRISTIRAALQDHGVMTSSELIDHLAGGNVNRACARQIIRRMSGGDVLWRSRKLNLPGRQRIFALPHFVGSDRFLHQVADLLTDSRPGLARCLRALLSKRVVLLEKALRLLATPLPDNPTGRYPSLDAELDALKELKAAQVEGEGTPLERLVQLGVEESASGKLALQGRRTITVERHLTRLIVDHFRNQGLIAWNRYDLPAEGAGFIDFNGFPFSASGFCWLKPVVRYDSRSGKGSPTPVLVDVTGDICSADDATSFTHRLWRAGSKRRPFLGIIAAPGFHNDAWKAAKKSGSLVVNLKQLVGEQALSAIEQMRSGLGYVPGAEAPTDDGIANLADLLKELRSNPFVVRLKSLAFETLAALVMRSGGWENVKVASLVPFGNTWRELDVYGERSGQREVFLVECKAKSTEALTRDEVGKFFTETVPGALKHFVTNTGRYTCSAEIWTTGPVGQDAANRLGELKLKASIRAKLRSGKDVAHLITPNIAKCKDLLKVIGAA